MPAVTPLLLGLLVAILTMAALWALHLRSSNAGVVDVGWVFLVGALAVSFAMTAEGWPWRRLAVAGPMAAWSARLGAYLLRDRVAGKPEDARYGELRRTWGRSAPVRFFWFFQLQAVAAVFFAIPAFIASANYFFEWMLWVANALFALSSPGGAFALLCPAVMLYLLFRVTGIPATEAQALRRRGDDYRDYQRTTNAFFPWRPRT